MVLSHFTMRTLQLYYSNGLWRLCHALGLVIDVHVIEFTLLRAIYLVVLVIDFAPNS